MSAGMKMDEEFGSDHRGIGIETDDEENEAERDCKNGDNNDDLESDSTPPHSRHQSTSIYGGDVVDPSSLAWPQSYSQWICKYTSVTPPSISFLRRSSSLSSAYKNSQQTLPIHSSLSKPLISVTDDIPTSTIPVKFSAASCSRFPSFTENLPPPAEQCSYSQSVLSAINALCGIGLLSTPYALKEGGLLSLILLLLLGVIATPEFC